MDGETASSAGARPPVGGDDGGRGRPLAWADGRRDRALAGSLPARGRECPPDPPEGRRGPKGRPDQAPQAEGGGTRPGPRHPQGGDAGPPFRPEDVRRVKATMPSVSARRCCRVLHVPRSALRAIRGTPRSPRLRRPLNADLLTRVAALIQAHPTFGARRLWALLRFREGWRINRKTVYRVLEHHWLVRPPAAPDAAAASPGPPERPPDPEHSLGSGRAPYPLRPRWLGAPHGGGRLP